MKLDDELLKGESGDKDGSWLVGFKFFEERPYLITLGLAGILLLVVGVVSAGMIAGRGDDGDGVEIVSGSEVDDEGEVYVDVGGAVIKPGLYRLAAGSRVNDALVAAGGLSGSADRSWFSKTINLAQKVSDGDKIYIPEAGVVAGSETVSETVNGKINVNTASVAELDSLWGVGVATAEKIVAGRPYGSVEELLDKKVVKSNVYERIKDEISVF